MDASYSEDFKMYLQPTRFIDTDSPLIIEFARESAGDAATPVEKAVRIFYAVRDRIRYDPYNIDISPERFKASAILARGSGYCVEKALVLVAAARVLGIPSRLRFADVRNHLTTERLKKIMQTDIFIFHGYTDLFLNDTWVKATPTFNQSLCKRFGVRPIDFDGIHDAIFHEFDTRGNKHMEYVHDRGYYADLPYEEIMTAMKQGYPFVFEKERDGSADTFEEEAARDAAKKS